MAELDTLPSRSEHRGLIVRQESSAAGRTIVLRCTDRVAHCSRRRGKTRKWPSGHLGGAAVQKVKHLTELAGVDVILVHRMLKNDVPVPEYMLMTEPVHKRIDVSMRERAAPHPLDLDDIGRTETYYVDLKRYVGEVPAPPRLSMPARIGRVMKLLVRSMPSMPGLRNACAGFRNVPDAPRVASS